MKESTQVSKARSHGSQWVTDSMTAHTPCSSASRDYNRVASVGVDFFLQWALIGICALLVAFRPLPPTANLMIALPVSALA